MPSKSSAKKIRLPRLDIKTGLNGSPHVVILGAGASRACCPNGDKSGNKLPLMTDLVETVGIEKIVREAGYDHTGNFEVIYNKIHGAGLSAVLNELDAMTRAYFAHLALPETPTLYDYLLLSLRPKDLIVTFNWDPLLPQAYKRWRHLGAVLPEIAFLHGNVDIGIDHDNKVSGFLSDEPYPGRKLVQTSLLYPVEQKDYSADLFIADQWRRATDYLSEAYFATIYGYSAPTTDVEARSLLLTAWRQNPTLELAEIDIIDIRDPEEVKASWSDFIVKTHGGASQSFEYNILLKHPRRSCEAFAFATLQQDPWREDPFPKAHSLKELEDWIKPLVDEEAGGKLSGKPHH
jgi:hypothetical protein